MSIRLCEQTNTKVFEYTSYTGIKFIITFVNNTFHDCHFMFINRSYDYHDWVLLGEISAEIQRLQQSMKGAKTDETDKVSFANVDLVVGG